MNLSLLKKRKLFRILIFCISLSALQAQTEEGAEFLFRFKFNKGDAYKIHSVVDEKVYANGRFHHQAQIINRITVEVSDVQPASGNSLSSALFSCEFMTSEQNSNKTFSWNRAYPSVFRRDELGVYTIEDKYFMPVVRDVPIFPEKAVKPLETWKSRGHEVHDFRDAFGIEKPFAVPFEVEYRYEGFAEIKGKTYRRISARYNLNYSVPKEVLQKYKGEVDIPIKTFGSSKQNLYWDEEKGNLFCYDEEFEIKLVLLSGYVLDFIGTAHAEVIETKKPDTTAEEEFKKNIKDLNLENTEVKQTEEGLTISLEKINFLPDSAILLDSEKEKLKKIAEVLIPFKDREFLISGHTALAGTAEARQTLSEERAAAVANYLIELGVQSREHVYTRGFGGRRPVVPNNSPENMAKNRRVEITILKQ
ncbi:OmpA family protein [Treponema pedis]|uniref:OmpA protein n=1 Tax=Treponema pedis str. T A4 TaxID=1291379 RepID=S6A2C4_9SPIR|nr:OmpA family protein [Treponema pedis]AGT42536.1 OmpA protein [Treponema pedis str. T A4]